MDQSESPMASGDEEKFHVHNTGNNTETAYTQGQHVCIHFTKFVPVKASYQVMRL